MLRQENFRQSNWLIELSPQKNVEPRIVGTRSTFRGSTFFRLTEIRLKQRLNEVIGYISDISTTYTNAKQQYQITTNSKSSRAESSSPCFNLMFPLCILA